MTRPLCRKAILLFALILCVHITLFAQNVKNIPKIKSAHLVSDNVAELVLDNQCHILIDFYGENIFRFFVDSVSKSFREPEAKPAAQILVDQPRKKVLPINIADKSGHYIVSSKKVSIDFDQSNSQFTITNIASGKTVVYSLQAVSFEKEKVSLMLSELDNEYYYGGGVQNGRFSHKGKIVSIENQNSWTDGGVASPNPFYWSTNGYGVMWYTFKKGKYDFGASQRGKVVLTHDGDYVDLFFMINDGVIALLNDFYQLTGNPVLLPKFGFYEGHLNAYNRDYWKEDSVGIAFEDGKKYKEGQKDNGGVKESLNGELKNNYQFSARAVIDRYKKNDMPLGWILPNDGYGAGYGQTTTLDSNVLNLKNFGDYARKNGVEIGLWTQSDLHPKDGISALLQRDILKEVRDAGVRVLKTDVAWVGAGYSFGLNGVADVANITSKYGNNARPFIISLDGWAGTQRYATIWTGDQTGGQWEYIRFHIPTYIGSGLSGNPNITSDMDGIFGGKNIPVNVRDFQWKTFTPMQLNMDGWGSNPKYPQALGEPAASINRNYLKLKSQLLPYAYSISKSAIDGLPIIRAMFLEEPNFYTLGSATKYQYMFGPYFLVAPIYQNTKADTVGNDIRNGIYLPKGNWIDYFTGEHYEGDRVINYFDAPLWKLPVFVKPGAIIPMTNANNNVAEINKALRIYEIYPSSSSSFTEYDDDGITETYKTGKGVFTSIHSAVDAKQTAIITIDGASGNFDGFVKEKETLLKINVSKLPQNVSAKINGKKVKLHYAVSLDAFNASVNSYYYDASPNLNQFATKGSDFAKTQISKNSQLLIKLEKKDITKNSITVTVKGFEFDIPNSYKKSTGVLNIAANPVIADKGLDAFSLTPTWKPVVNADYYEIEFNNILYSHIKNTAFVLDELQPETNYSMKLRAVNKTGYSDWVTLSGKTKVNPLQFAIKGIKGYSTAASQGGEGVNQLFDFDESNNWHTQYGLNAIPFDLIMDLKSINQLDKLQYLPRTSGRNGLIVSGKIFYSSNKKDWIEAGNISWTKDNAIKEFVFTNHPSAKFIKLSVTEGVGNFGSGREIYVFKVPGSASFIPGDINNDGKIDENDLTSYTNYTGLRKGDGDFDGYISNGDINKNGLIDAFDISNVATQLDGGVNSDSVAVVSGRLIIMPDKASYKAGETIELKVLGQNLRSVNALSFALPYSPQSYEYVGVEPLNTAKMENLTYDRLHTNGSKSLYPTFVNLGDKQSLNGSATLFVIRFKAKRDIKFDLKAADGLLVDKDLTFISAF